MSDFNPYAAPQARLETTLSPFSDKDGGLWQDGPLLLIRKGSAGFPDRCLKCNEPAEGQRLKRTLSWHHPAWFILAVSPLIYIIVALIVRKTGKISAPICSVHRSKRKRAILFGWAGALLGIILFVMGLSESGSGVLMAIGLGLIAVSLIAGILMSTFVTPTRIDKNFIWLKGVSPDFLRMLPEWGSMNPNARANNVDAML